MADGRVTMHAVDGDAPPSGRPHTHAHPDWRRAAPSDDGRADSRESDTHAETPSREREHRPHQHQNHGIILPSAKRQPAMVWKCVFVCLCCLRVDVKAYCGFSMVVSGPSPPAERVANSQIVPAGIIPTFCHTGSTWELGVVCREDTPFSYWISYHLIGNNKEKFLVLYTRLSYL